MVAHSEAVPRRRRRSHRAVARRFDSAGPFTYVFLILVVMVSLFPLYWSLVVASHDNAAVYAYPPKLLPGSNLFHNIHRLFNSDLVSVDFAKALVNSVIVAGSITVSMLVFCSLAGFAFAKLRFRGRNALLLVVIATMMCPVQLGVIPLYIEMQALGWAQHLLAVIVPTAVTGFGVVFMRQYTVQAVPDELLEAGRMDGCSSWGLYRHVVLPALRPAMAVLGLLTFMQAWNDFMWPVIVLSPQNPTVQVALSTLAAGKYMDYALVLAGTALAILPILIVFGLFGRRIIGGVMEGAVKG